MLQLIQERRNICKHIHLPAQSGSSRVLHAMRRGYELLNSFTVHSYFCQYCHCISFFYVYMRVGIAEPDKGQLQAVSWLQSGCPCLYISVIRQYSKQQGGTAVFDDALGLGKAIFLMSCKFESDDGVKKSRTVICM